MSHLDRLHFSSSRIWASISDGWHAVGQSLCLIWAKLTFRNNAQQIDPVLLARPVYHLTNTLPLR